MKRFEVVPPRRDYEAFQIAYALDVTFGGQHTVTEITEPEKCVWTRISPFEMANWRSRCGATFEFEHRDSMDENDTPKDYGWEHCPYCGKPIKVRDEK